MSKDHARRAVELLADLDVEIVDARTLAQLIRELAEAHSTYDAHYVALARTLDAVLVTANAELTRALPESSVQVV